MVYFFRLQEGCTTESFMPVSSDSDFTGKQTAASRLLCKKGAQYAFRF